MTDPSNKSEQPGGLSYHRQAQIDQELEFGGRFRAEEINSGSEEAVPYPRPEGPWAGGPSPGLERPLGYSINDLEPTGEPFEVQHSLLLAAVLVGEKAEAVAPANASPATAVETLPRPFSSASPRIRRRRL
jgi:hypothetical protein